MGEAMNSPVLWLDILVVVILILLSIRIFSEASLFKSVVLFIALGLFVSFAWVKLAAPDVALAEAALGAGITGALLLDTVGHLRGRSVPYSKHQSPEDRTSQNA